MSDQSRSPSSVAPSPAPDHRAAGARSVGCAVLTLSDTRTAESDTSGALIRELLGANGHRCVDYRIIHDEPSLILQTLNEWAGVEAIEAILTNGGTGIAPRDSTYDTLSDLIEKRIDGFGELFRMLSYAEIGPAAMLSRAVAGVWRGRLIVAMPGSRNAVELAMEQLIVPEIGHLVFEINKRR